MWRNDYDRLGLPEGTLRDGLEVVVAGGCEYFVGSAGASPRFNFRVRDLRPAGEGDLLLQLAALRKQFAAERLGDRQRALPRPVLPRRIGVVTAAGSAARADVLAGLARRAWRGEVVFAHVPVQGVKAAPLIAQALGDLAAIESVETIIVARGGGSLLDLWAFCDESLCRTVAMLRVPVITGIGHETDQTLIEEVAAVACSTPTHTAEAAIRVDLAAERSHLVSRTGRLVQAVREARSRRTAPLGAIARALAHHNEQHRRGLHQRLREVRASGQRSLTKRREVALDHATRLAAAQVRVVGSDLPRRLEANARFATTLDAHHPERVIERGYAVVRDRGGRLLTSAVAARASGRIKIRFSDDTVEAEVPNDG